MCSLDKQPCSKIGVRFRVSGSRFRVEGLGFMFWDCILSTSSSPVLIGFRLSGFGLRVESLGVLGSGFSD